MQTLIKEISQSVSEKDEDLHQHPISLSDVGGAVNVWYKCEVRKSQNTTRLLSVDSVVNKTTCFVLLGGHHQFYQLLAIGD